MFLRALSALFELEGVLSVGRIEELEWDTTDILDPENGRSFYVLFLALFFAVIWRIHVKEIRLILRREATCSIISKETSSAWSSTNENGATMERTKRDRSIFVRKI